MRALDFPWAPPTMSSLPRPTSEENIAPPDGNLCDLGTIPHTNGVRAMSILANVRFLYRAGRL